MTVFNFTLRAEDDRGAFSDRQFSIKVRNTLVDRYMMIDANHAYTSLDLENWTERTDMGGTDVTYGGGNWLVWRGNNAYRLSPDGINWTQHTVTAAGFNSPVRSCPVWKDDRWFVVAGTTVCVVLSSVDGIVWEIVNATAGGMNASYALPEITTTTNGALVINFVQSTSAASYTMPYPLISYDNGANWETAIKTLPAGLVHQNAHYSQQSMQRSSNLTFINGLWYYCYSGIRSHYSTANDNTYAGRYHYIGYSHDLVNFTRCDVDDIILSRTNISLGSGGIGGLIRRLHYVNGVLVVETGHPNNLSATNPSRLAYSVDGRSFQRSQMDYIDYNLSKVFQSQGKVYQYSAKTNLLRVSEDNGRTFVSSESRLPSTTLTGFARI